MNVLKRFKEDKSGIVWIFIVIIVGMLVYSLLWFSLGFALFEVADTVEANYTFTEPIASAALFIRTIFMYHPIIVLFGLLTWGYVNSQRRGN